MIEDWKPPECSKGEQPKDTSQENATPHSPPGLAKPTLNEAVQSSTTVTLDSEKDLLVGDKVPAVWHIDDLVLGLFELKGSPSWPATASASIRGQSTDSW